jgi:hypothetical protein
MGTFITDELDIYFVIESREQISLVLHSNLATAIQDDMFASYIGFGGVSDNANMEIRGTGITCSQHDVLNLASFGFQEAISIM